MRARKRQHKRRRPPCQRRLGIEVLEKRRVLATYFVDTLVDSDSGLCAPDDAAGNVSCSLRLAIDSANLNPGSDVVQVPDGTYTLDSDGGPLTIAGDDLQIIGNPANPSAVKIDGDAQSRVLDSFGPPAQSVASRVQLQGLEIRNGRADDGRGGGGISASSDVDLELENVFVENNMAIGQPGGGVLAEGNLTIRFSSIRNNQSQSSGGGIAFAAMGEPKTLDIGSSVITGNRAGLDGGGVSVENIDTTLRLDSVTIDANTADDSGGGIYAFGAAVDIANSQFLDNAALGSSGTNAGIGGGLLSEGQTGSLETRIRDSSFQRNTALLAGGIASLDNDLDLQHSVIESNQSISGDGGGVLIERVSRTPTLRIQSSTLFANTSAARGGGIAIIDGGIDLENVAISGNDASDTGGGIAYQNFDSSVVRSIRFTTIHANTSVNVGSNLSGQGNPLTLMGTILSSGDSDGSPGTFVSAGGNIDQGTSTGLGDVTDRNNLNPQLGPLQDNGGGVPTHGLLPGSPAIDTGPTPHPSTDARGFTRPTDGDNDALAAVDVGAFEAEPIVVAALSISDVSIAESAGQATVLVTLDNAVSGGFSVDFATNPIAPTDTTDYTPTSGTLNFVGTAGESQSFMITIFDDSIVEPSEQINVQLLNVSRPGVDASANGMVEIVDNDTATVSVDHLTVSEGDTDALVTLRLSHQVQGGLDVDFTTGDGTATSPQDFQSLSGTINFTTPGPQIVAVPLTNDSLVEDLETFTVTISGATPLGASPPPGSAIIAGASGSIDIVDKDLAHVFIAEDVIVDEDNATATIALTLEGDVEAPFQVDVDTLDIPASVPLDFPGRADQGTDYVAIDQTVTFSGFDGETQLVTIDLTADTIVEADESFVAMANDIRAGGRNVQFDHFPNVDVSQISSFATVGDAIKIRVLGTRAFVAAGTSGIEILDVSDPTSITSLGTFDTPGEAVDLQIIGNTLYVADSASGLLMLDVRDPTMITPIGSFDTAGTALGIQVIGFTVYVADGVAGLQVLDTSSPQDISSLGSFDTAGEALQVHVEQDVAYVADGSSGLQLLDVVDPSNLVLLGSFDTPGLTRSIEIFPDESVVLIADGDPGLSLVDVSDPAAMFAVDTFDTPGTAIRASTEFGGLTIAADGADGIRFVDLRGIFESIGMPEIRSPIPLSTTFGTFVESFDTPGFASHVEVIGRTAFVADGPGGVRVLDFQTGRISLVTIANDDQATLQVTGADANEDTGTLSVSVNLSGNVDTPFTVQVSTQDLGGGAVSAEDYTSLVQTLNFSGGDGETVAVTIPVTADSTVEPDELIGLSVTGLQASNRAVSVSAAGLERIDIASAGSLPISGGANGLAISGSKAYVASGSLGTQLVDTSDFGSLNVISTVGGIDFASAVDTAGNQVVVAAGASGLQIVDAEDLANLIEDDRLDTPDFANDVQAVNEFVYVADETTGLIVIDSTDPGDRSPVTFDTPGIALAVHVVEGLAYVADGPSGLQILDVSDPSNIQLKGSFDTPGNAEDVFVVGAVAYVADGVGGLQILDVSDPSNVVSLGSVAAGDAVGIEVVDTAAYLIDTTIGLVTLDVSDPANVRSLGQFATPGPANSVTVVGTNALVTDDTGFHILSLTPVFGVGRIINDDSASISISDAVVDETDAVATVTISSNAAVQGGFDVDIVTVDGTATEPDDYGATSTTLRFSGGRGESQTLSIPIISDSVDEPSETFSIVVASVTPLGNNAVSSSRFDITAVGNVTINSTITAEIVGHVYCDANGNGTEDVGEEVTGSRVFLDQNGNRRFETGEPFVLTDASGNYRLGNVTDAFVTVVTDVPAGCNTIPQNPGVQRSTIDVGDLARSITSADVDGDGDPDLLVASDRSASLVVLENRGGEFQLMREIPLGDRPQSVDVWVPEASVGEDALVREDALNDDDIAPTIVPTIAVAGVGTPSDGGAVFMLHGSEVNRRVVGDGPIEVVLDDFDQDGLPDILSAAFRSSDLRLALSSGEGNATLSSGRLVRAIDSGNFDNDPDGFRDIVVAGFGYEGDDHSIIEILIGDEQSAFAVSHTIEATRQSVAVEAFDVDQDGTDEILVLSEQGVLAVYQLRDGQIVLLAQTDVGRGSTSMAFGDFNRDEQVDVAIANLGRQRIDLYVGDGEGRFVNITTISEVAAPSDLVVDDFDGDGFDEIAVANLYSDAAIGNPDAEGPIYRLPSTATVLRISVAENAVVISDQLVTQVDFEFTSADPTTRLDVNGDSSVTAQDALHIVNRLAKNHVEGEQAGRIRQDALDVNADGRITALDALLVINYLQHRQHAPTASSIEPPLVRGNLLDEEDDELLAAIDLVLTQLPSFTL